ncbi:MAG: hypothetical protein IKP36_10695 [Bacteroidaceae bacterium]|nr:hypothetical protein [Bacteroidaceae bacterium]
MSVADSLYNCMQFRDAYKLYRQLLDNKEAKADSNRRTSKTRGCANSLAILYCKAE